jgi:AraC-like DNA-binding protein
MKQFGAIPMAGGEISRLAFARASRQGIDLRPLLVKAGLTEKEIEDRGIRLNVRRQVHFLNLVAAALRDDFLGFHLAQTFELRSIALLYYVPASSETLGDALRRLARYSSIVNEGMSLSYIPGQYNRVVFDYAGIARHSDRQQIEFWMTGLFRLCRQLTGMRLAPSHVRLIHSRSEKCSEIAGFFGNQIEFGATVDEVAFPGDARHLPVVSADRYLNELLVAYCEEALSRRRTKGGPFRTAVENSIVPLLPHGKANAGEIARKLGMSQRTLARRLSSEELTFSEVREGLRRDLAGQYLADPGLSISRIAWLLGYQEVSAFTHAFKRWTGKKPREARSGERPHMFALAE